MHRADEIDGSALEMLAVVLELRVELSWVLTQCARWTARVLPWDLQRRSKELTPSSCPLTSTPMPRYMCITSLTQNKYRNLNCQMFVIFSTIDSKSCPCIILFIWFPLQKLLKIIKQVLILQSLVRKVTSVSNRASVMGHTFYYQCKRKRATNIKLRGNLHFLRN